MEKWKELLGARKNQIIAGVCMVVVALLILIPLANGRIQEKRYLALRETIDFDDEDFDSTHTLILNGAYWLTLEQVEKGLDVSPRASYQVLEGEEDGQFLILFEDPGKSPYNVTFTEPSGKFFRRTKVNEMELTVRLADLNVESFGVGDVIILEFSDSVGEFDLRPWISIEPEISFEMFGRDDLFYIQPYWQLDYDTTYTITVKKGLRSYDGEMVLKKDAVLTLHTERRGFSASFINPSTNVLTATDTELELSFNTYLEDTPEITSVPMEISVYAFADLDSYLTGSSELVSDKKKSLGHLRLEASYTHDLTNLSSSFGIPNPGIGSYIIQMVTHDPETGKEFEFRKTFAVTDLSVYAQTSNTQTLVWAHSSVTGEALPGYQVQFYENGKETKDPVVQSSTNADGIATMRYTVSGVEGEPGPGRVLVLRDSAGDVVYVDNTSVLNQYNRQTKPNRYYSFLMLDRPIYRPTDEVQFWGMVRGWKDNQDPMPSTVKVILGEGHIDQVVELPLNSDGTFQGKFDLEQVKTAGYRVMLRLPSTASDNYDDDYTLCYEYIQVKEFQKPIYVVSVENDKDFYLPGEQVTASIKPTFYDGTPMPFFNMEFSLRQGYYGSYDTPETITTDENGVATVTFDAHQASGRRGWLPTTGSYMVRIVDDGENITQYGSYRYLPSSTVAAGSVTEVGENQLNLQIETYGVNTGNIKTVEDLNRISSINYSYDYYGYSNEQLEYLKGAPVSIPVSVTVEYSYYRSNMVWRYNEWSRSSNYVETWEWTKEKQEFTVNTVNGVGTLEDILGEIPYDAKRYSSVNITMDYQDSDGNDCTSTYYWYNRGRHISSSGTAEEKPTHSPGYSFELVNSSGDDVLAEYQSYLTYNQATVGDGEAMHFSLLYQGEPVDNNGQILWTLLQEEIMDQGITTSRTLSFSQNVSRANSFNLVAAYFDGTTVWPIRNTVVTFDKTSIVLDVEITPDRETYGPGDTVTLTVKVTDQNGNGVAGVTGISIVDESIFALQEQYIDVMYDLYKDFFFSHYHVPKYATGKGDFLHEYGMGDGGKGGETNLAFLDSLRKNFRDTALFRTVRTDASGNAVTTFTLPDNVTSWRITGVSIGDNLYAGQSKANFISTMPFFVSPVISTKYIDGDDIAMLVQGHGVALNADSQINYWVNIKGDGVDLTQEVTNKAYQTNHINFGKLPQGEYVVTVGATSGEYMDAVELPLAVIKSNLELVISKPVNLQQPLDINAMRYPVTMTFYDENHDAYYSSISSLLTHYCMMSSQRMSRYTAKKSLTQFMADEDIPQHIRATSENLADMQNYDGGIGSAIGNPSDPYITAMVLIVAPDQFDRESMTSYFRTTLENTKYPEYVAYSYLGLGVLGEPIGAEVRQKIQDPGTDEFLRAYLIAALAYLGDTEGASQFYEQYVTPHMVSERNGRYYRSTAGKNPKMTAAVWIAASVLGHGDADGISIHFAEYPWRINTLFECMVYINHYDKEVIQRTFTYNVGGEDIVVDLGLRGSKTITFNKSQFQALRFVDVPEEIIGRAYFIGEPEEVDIEPSEEVAITKTVTPISGDRYKISITLTFADDAPLGYYDISEWVPSNMRLYTIDRANRGSGDYWYYNYSTEGQKIYFRLYRTAYDANRSKTITLNYTAQQTYDAEAVVDSAYIIHGETGINNMTPKSMIGG